MQIGKTLCLNEIFDYLLLHVVIKINYIDNINNL